MRPLLPFTLVLLGLAACGSSNSGTTSATATPDASVTSSTPDGSTLDDASAITPVTDAATNDAPDADASNDAGGYPLPDGGTISADRFVTSVVSFNPTACAGFGQVHMPGIVEGPPHGGGSQLGSTDVVSLGSGGSIVVSFAPNAIVDGPGPDFIVFENPFWIGGSSADVYAEPGEISVSDDGVAWTAFPCDPTADPNASDGTGVAPPYPATCGGWQVVDSAPGNGVSPIDPTTAGGLALDLASIGVTHAQYVRIVDKTNEECPDAGGPITNGFDLDAIAIVNAENP